MQHWNCVTNTAGASGVFTAGASGVFTVGPSGTCAPLTFTLLNVILNKHIVYLFCSCYMHIMNNLDVHVVVTLCSHESVFHAGYCRAIIACSISTCALVRLVLWTVLCKRALPGRSRRWLRITQVEDESIDKWFSGTEVIVFCKC